jgi:uncharacterized membrane protein YbaN (DUF454 family)
MQWIYLVLAIIGAVLPLSCFIPFLLAHGFDLPLIVRDLFQNNISASFGLDVIISALVVYLFFFHEGQRRGMKHLWVYVICTTFVGVSLGLPLFLFFRERKLKVLSV